MAYKYFSRNGEILPTEQATISLGNVAYAYGFGVYETIRVSQGEARFISDHCRRLMTSAKTIGLEHNFDEAFVQKAIQSLIEANQAEICNLKILLIGGPSAEQANLNILCLNPLFPDRKLYQTGASAVTYIYERLFPAAKTLNMLPSYLAYREAKKAGAYDALLINRHGCVTEGTRSNFFAVKGRTLVSPPAEDILPGVTRAHVIEVATQSGFKVVERDIKLEEIKEFDGACLTATGIKILPLRSIDDHVWPEIPAALRELVAAYGQRY